MEMQDYVRQELTVESEDGWDGYLKCDLCFKRVREDQQVQLQAATEEMTGWTESPYRLGIIVDGRRHALQSVTHLRCLQ